MSLLESMGINFEGWLDHLLGKNQTMKSVQEYLSDRSIGGSFIHPYFNDLDGGIHQSERKTKFSHNISHNLKNPTASAYIGSYRKESTKEYLGYTDNHIATIPSNSKILADNVLVFVHPFYIQISEPEKLKTPKSISQSNNYLSSLFSLLDAQEKTHDFSTVMIGTALHYAASGAFLLKEGVIQNYFITDYVKGDLLRKSDLDVLKNKSIYVGGTFNVGLETDFNRKQALGLYKTLRERTDDDVTNTQTIDFHVISDLFIARSDEKEYRRLRERKIPDHSSISKVSSKELIERMQSAYTLMDKSLDPSSTSNVDLA